MCEIIEYSQKTAYQAVNTTLIHRNWLLGYRIASEELQGEDRAKYGAEIFQTVSRKSVLLLSWSHYATLLQVKDEKARKWYEKEAIEQTWSVRTLQRNISSKYYYRILKTQKKELVESEMKEMTAEIENQKAMFYLRQRDR